MIAERTLSAEATAELLDISLEELKSRDLSPFKGDPKKFVYAEDQTVL